MKKWNPSTLPFKPSASIIAVSVAAAFALTACGGGGSDPSRVSATQGGTAENVAVNQATPVTLTFVSRDGTSRDLAVTGLDALPAGWTVADENFACPEVTTGNACQLTLTYTPTAVTAASDLEINYTYTDDKGRSQPGTAIIKYSAITGSGSTAAFAFIAQRGETAGTGSILRCSVAADGTLSDCADSGAGALPAPVSLNVSGSDLYVLNETAATPAAYSLYRCAIGADGSVSGCADQEETVPGEESDIRVDFSSGFAIFNSQPYVLKIGGQILQCTNTGGAISDCIEPTGSAVSGLSIPADFAFTDSRVYVANTGSTPAEGSVSVCAVAADTGIISDCSTASADAALQNDPTGIAINGTNAYVVTRGNNSVVQCTVDSATGTLGACTGTELPAATGTGEANRIAIQGNFAYITSRSGTAADNSVVKCTINPATGALEGCGALTGITYTGEASDIDFFAPQS